MRATPASTTTTGLSDLSAATTDFLAQLRSTGVASQAAMPAPRKPIEPVTLSAEQQHLVDVVATGRDVIVDACVGAGKTTAIQALCCAQPPDRSVLYLTYSKLLKMDAQRRVSGAKVQNYHGIVYPSLLRAGLKCGLGESIRKFNENFRDLSATFPRYDLLVIDEYQDITEEYAQLLENIKSVNPLMQVVMVGDMAQKVRSDTTLDVLEFVKSFCLDPVQVPFTQSFRAGQELGELLAQAWNKPIVGVNPDQKISYVDFDQAMTMLGEHSPGDVLCLGSRNGPMSQALNLLERTHPTTFNKDSVYASIRDGDSSVTYGDDAAVFTTFDSSKGLERPVVFVFDYDPKMWDMRHGFAGSDPVVLRNVFLVAASRAKREVVFVRGKHAKTHRDGQVGYIDVSRFIDLPAVTRPQYRKPFWASEAFDFKYAENVRSCYDLLDVKRLDDGTGEVIEVPRTDGLIDLSPVVGHYQEAIFFEHYDAKYELLRNPNEIAGQLAAELTNDAWRNALLLTAVDTEQMRYADQVKASIPADVERALIARLGQLLPRDAQIQMALTMQGLAKQTRTDHSPIVFEGVADAVHDERLYELKFVTELSHANFLQLGLYLVMSGRSCGVLWNTRTDERWEVRVPDARRFMDAVVLCVSKQAYRAFEAD